MLSWIDQFKVWEPHVKDHCCQEADKDKKYFGEGGRVVGGCWCLPQKTVTMGTQWTSLRISVSTDVLPCCHNWLDWIWPCHLPGPEGIIARMRPGGRIYCHGAHSPWLYPGRHRRPLPACIPAPEVTWERLVGEGYHRTPLPRCSWLTQSMPPA